ncbi:MAG: Asp23/Gls24 family envelope stress response protein [Clostridiales bacterium]|nr:Asp23/Gls24 family envelope stress response protein [Clostridiales bacterium]
MTVYKNNTIGSGKGKVVYNVGIVKGIVRLAVEDVEGVAIQNKKKYSKKSVDDIKVEVVNGNINVSVNVEVYYGYSIPDVAYNIQGSVKHSVESMSKYKIGTVDVKVSGVIFPDEAPSIE